MRSHTPRVPQLTEITQFISNQPLRELCLFDLKVKGSHVETIRNADASLGEAFAADARVLDGDVELEVVLKPSKKSRQGALSRLRGAPKALARDRDLRENAQRFQVKGKHDGTGRVEIIDLLHDQLISRKQVLRIGSKKPCDQGKFGIRSDQRGTRRVGRVSAQGCQSGVMLRGFWKRHFLRAEGAVAIAVTIGFGDWYWPAIPATAPLRPTGHRPGTPATCLGSAGVGDECRVETPADDVRQRRPAPSLTEM